MRLSFALVGVVALLPLGAAAQDAEPSHPGPAGLASIVDATGQPLREARILRFDGVKFEVEHAEGLSTIPWQRMPDEIRWRYPFDARRAELLEQQAAERRAVAAAEAARQAAAAPSPVPTPTSGPKPRVVRAEIRLGELTILPKVGGPPGELKILEISQTEVNFARHKYGQETRELRLGIGENRTLLYRVGDCDVYFVNVAPSSRYNAVVEFEYAATASAR
ncbi:MAG: hypothetical protein JSR82_17845 [Verrucomicrobia bacterium]|nr:hypothetical protein [Verrucomicrobiota bacterium]